MFVIEIINILQQTSKTIFFKWVRGHSSIEGNEKVNKLAKEVVEATFDSTSVYFNF